MWWSCSSVTVSPMRSCNGSAAAPGGGGGGAGGGGGFKRPQPAGINTSNAGDGAMKGEMEAKHGSSNQQAYAAAD